MIFAIAAAVLVAFFVRAFARMILSHLVGILILLFALWFIGAYVAT